MIPNKGKPKELKYLSLSRLGAILFIGDTPLHNPKSGPNRQSSRLPSFKHSRLPCVTQHSTPTTRIGIQIWPGLAREAASVSALILDAGKADQTNTNLFLLTHWLYHTTRFPNRSKHTQARTRARTHAHARECGSKNGAQHGTLANGNKE